MRPRRYTKKLLKQVKELHLKGCTGVEISKRLDIPTSSISLFKSANFDLETYLQNNLENTRYYTPKKIIDKFKL